MSIPLSSYTYDLPEARIAKYPLKERDKSKLLVYRHGDITHKQFYQLPEQLNSGDLLVFNNTRVIPARLQVASPTGALIEVLLEHAHQPGEVNLAMQATKSCSWHCVVGNKKRWKEDTTLRLKLEDGHHLYISWKDRDDNVVQFEWEGGHAFAEILEMAGKVPLPPYLNREAEARDKSTYQTVYAENKGAVAAPTAGLHFTDKVFEELDRKGVEKTFVTLHVGAGTFMPIKTEDATRHTMHAEQLVVTKALVQKLFDHKGRIIAVGTTSMRLLESIYWMGIKMLQQDWEDFFLFQEDTTKLKEKSVFNQKQVWAAWLRFFKEERKDHLVTETQLYIYPGYEFKVCDGLITNYHQPGSSLLLLVAAFVGEDWKKVYDAALDNEYRFLSYGDSSLLLPKG